MTIPAHFLAGTARGGVALEGSVTLRPLPVETGEGSMTDAFWSHWAFFFNDAATTEIYTWLVFRQWLERRKPHQLAWTVGLLFYAVAAVMESVSEAVGSWDPFVYRIYIVLAASLVGFLGLGSLYLLAKNRLWGNLYLAFNLVAVAVFLYGTFTTQLHFDKLVPGITVGGQALGASMSFPRVMSFAFNIPGSIFLLGGAILSILKFARKPEYHYRMWANVLIALGTIVIAGVGARARLGESVGLYPAEMVASALLLWGFLMAGTLERGAKAIKQKHVAQKSA
jgi:hypothetical protein